MFLSAPRNTTVHSPLGCKERRRAAIYDNVPRCTVSKTFIISFAICCLAVAERSSGTCECVVVLQGAAHAGHRRQLPAFVRAGDQRTAQPHRVSGSLARDGSGRMRLSRHRRLIKIELLQRLQPGQLGVANAVFNGCAGTSRLRLPHHPSQREKTERLIAFRSHWGFHSEFCNPARVNEDTTRETAILIRVRGVAVVASN
jgi:hypothetical protein